MNVETTICALATAPGGAIGIIRVSGADAITITDKIFSKSLSAAKSQTVHYGEIKDADGNTIDDVLVSVFRAPHSYTLFVVFNRKKSLNGDKVVLHGT